MYLLLCLSVFIAVWFISINVIEIFHQLKNDEYTIFSQITSLSKNQIILCCAIEILIYLICLFFLAKFLYRKRKKQTVWVAVCIIAITILILYIESTFTNYFP